MGTPKLLRARKAVAIEWRYSGSACMSGMWTTAFSRTTRPCSNARLGRVGNVAASGVWAAKGRDGGPRLDFGWPLVNRRAAHFAPGHLQAAMERLVSPQQGAVELARNQPARTR